MEITNEIKELIQKQLPGLHANALKEFITEAEQQKLALKGAQELNKKQQAEIVELGLINNQKTIELGKAKEILAREAQSLLERQVLELEKLKFTVEKEAYKFKYDLLTSSKNDVFNFLSLLVKNPRAVEILNTQQNIPVWENYPSGGGFHTTKIETTSGTKETQETKEG